MTAKPPLHRSSACSTPNGAAAVAAAAAAAAAASADVAEDAAWPDAPSPDAAWEWGALYAAAVAAASDGWDAHRAAAAAASPGAPASSARLARVSIALTDAVRHGLTRPGGPRSVYGTFRVVCDLRFAAESRSTRSSNVDPQRPAAQATTFLQIGEPGFQWRL